MLPRRSAPPAATGMPRAHTQPLAALPSRAINIPDRKNPARQTMMVNKRCKACRAASNLAALRERKENHSEPHESQEDVQAWQRPPCCAGEDGTTAQLNGWGIEITWAALPDPTTEQSRGWSGAAAAPGRHKRLLLSRPRLSEDRKNTPLLPAAILLCFLLGEEDAALGRDGKQVHPDSWQQRRNSHAVLTSALPGTQNHDLKKWGSELVLWDPHRPDEQNVTTLLV